MRARRQPLQTRYTKGNLSFNPIDAVSENQIFNAITFHVAATRRASFQEVPLELSCLTKLDPLTHDIFRFKSPLRPDLTFERWEEDEEVVSSTHLHHCMCRDIHIAPAVQVSELDSFTLINRHVDRLIP